MKNRFSFVLIPDRGDAVFSDRKFRLQVTATGTAIADARVMLRSGSCSEVEVVTLEGREAVANDVLAALSCAACGASVAETDIHVSENEEVVCARCCGTCADCRRN